MPSIKFKANKDMCTRCGLCVADCPAGIIVMTDHGPRVPPEKESLCYRCEHCLAVCPAGAASVFGLDPAASTPLAGAFPSVAQMEALIKGRRSVRRYKDEDLSPRLIYQLIETALHAPSGRNARKVLVTVIDNRATLAKFRGMVLEGLARVTREGKLPPGMERFAEFPVLWETKKVDVVFRGAPHLLVASAPRDCASPLQDCLIVLSYFELLAQTQGIGTVWDGIARWVIGDILPELCRELKIPDDHLIGYVMAFGKPAVKYSRTVQHGPANVVTVDLGA